MSRFLESIGVRGDSRQIITSANFNKYPRRPPNGECAYQLVRQTVRTIIVLVTDFYEGHAERDLVNQVQEMAQAGVRVIGLGALGHNARPEFNATTAAKCRKVGDGYPLVHTRKADRGDGTHHPWLKSRGR